MGLDKTIISLVMNVTKNVSKFELSIDSLQSQFNNGCPTKDNIFKIIKSKNQISSILSQTQSQLQVLNSTKTTLEISNNTFSTIINTIKSIPAPTAVAGVGVPFASLTRLSDTLYNIGDKLKQGRGILKTIPSIVDSINEYIDSINNKLKILDESILKCLEKDIEILNEVEREKFISDLGINVNTNNDTQNNSNNNKIQPYKGYSFTIDYDASNKFSFPRRRIKAQNGKITLIGDFSYSISVDILVKEMKFKIDNL